MGWGDEWLGFRRREGGGVGGVEWKEGSQQAGRDREPESNRQKEVCWVQVDGWPREKRSYIDQIGTG